NNDEFDDTALMLAALHGHKDVVQALIVRGAKVDDRNRFGETALMQAALAGFPEIVQLLLESGSDINARDVDSSTALILAYNDRETTETLLRGGADFKAKDKNGMTALMIAVGRYESEKEQALINVGAGKESIEACKAYMASNPPDQQYFNREEGYRILSEIYVKLGMKKEAVEASKEALTKIGDEAHLRARLGFTYIAVGDRVSALAQYKILMDRASKATDENTRELYSGWAESLFEELNR